MITENRGQINQITGKGGEDVACEYLKSQGYTIVHRNYRIAHDEIDIIAEDDKYVVFVEVKTRTERMDSRYGSPSAAVNAKKRACVARAAARYIKSRGTNGKFCRCDVIEVLICSDKVTGRGYTKIRHLRSAFGAGGRLPPF